MSRPAGVGSVICIARFGGGRKEFGSGIVGINVRRKEVIVWRWILEMERRGVEVEGIHFEVEVVGDSEMNLRLRSTMEREGHRVGVVSDLRFGFESPSSSIVTSPLSHSPSSSSSCGCLLPIILKKKVQKGKNLYGVFVFTNNLLTNETPPS